MDRENLEALVRAHQAEIYRYARYLGADRSAAEDIVQETFLAALRSRRSLAGAEFPVRAAWLRGVARNVFLMHCRRARYSPVVVDPDSLDRAEAVWSREFLRSGDGFDYVEALRECLGALSEKHRRVLEMRYGQGRSRSKMAAVLRMTEDGVKSLLRRLRTGLADCVGRHIGLERG